MNTDIDLYINELRHAITAAGLNYEIWSIYKHRSESDEEVMNKYELFFQTSIHAHFVALLVLLYRLYEKRRQSDTFNIPSLLKILKTEALLSDAKLESLKSFCKSDVQPIWIKVCILRNYVFCHRSTVKTVEEAFRKADMTATELGDLIETTKKFLNKLTRAYNKSSHSFTTGASEDIQQLLDDLRSLNRR